MAVTTKVVRLGKSVATSAVDTTLWAA